MIEIKQLYKSYGELEVLKDINLTVNTGEIYGLVGRSGAGKSTLLRCINGLENYQSGSLKIDGTEMKDLSKTQLREFQKEIGMIFQHFSLVERRNVYKNIALPMVCWKYKKEDIDKRVQELAKLVEISDKLYDRPRMLSGGQKQRVAIARALSMNANLLLCDEATSALDPNTTQSVLNLLRELNQKLGITIVVVTHQMEVVRQICDTISIDRKSTRLNSSHTVISYAVFCLKKKNFFNDTATTEIYTLSLHDALPIYLGQGHCRVVRIGNDHIDPVHDGIFGHVVSLPYFKTSIAEPRRSRSTE